MTATDHPIDKMTAPPALTLKVMQAQVLEVNRANGWHDESETLRTFGDDVALLHTEVSEMFEAYRDWHLEDVTLDQCSQPDHDEHLCKPQGVGSEAADILIRLLDTCQRNNIDLEAEYRRKLAFNRTRGYRHGGKHI